MDINEIMRKLELIKSSLSVMQYVIKDVTEDIDDAQEAIRVLEDDGK